MPKTWVAPLSGDLRATAGLVNDICGAVALVGPSLSGFSSSVQALSKLQTSRRENESGFVIRRISVA